MRTINLYFVFGQIVNDAGKSFINSCKKNKIPAKVVKTGSGRKHCVGEYKYRWIETSTPNFVACKEHLQNYNQLVVYFYTKEDMDEFVEEFRKIIKWSHSYTVYYGYYYGISSVYELKIIK